MPKSSAAMPSDPDVDPDAPYLAVLLDFPNGPSSNAGHVQASEPVLASSGLEAFDLALQHHNFDSLQQPTTQLLLGSPDALVDGMLVETVSEAFGSSPQQHQASPWQVRDHRTRIMACLLCPGPWPGPLWQRSLHVSAIMGPQVRQDAMAVCHPHRAESSCLQQLEASPYPMIA